MRGLSLFTTYAVNVREHIVIRLYAWATSLSAAMHPPNPDMRIEHDHVAASQSEFATGSVGLTYLIGVPRSG
jgi:hypothetical protein